MKIFRKIIYRIPRIPAVLFICFPVMFSLDVIEPGRSRAGVNNRHTVPYKPENKVKKDEIT